MAFFNLQWQIIAFADMNMFEQVLNAADWVTFTIEDCEVYDKIVKVRSFKHCPWPDPTLRSDWLTGDVSLVSRFLRWQLLFLAGN